METANLLSIRALRPAWNKGRIVGQKRTLKPVRFEISAGIRSSVAMWMEDPMMVGCEYLWPGLFHERLHISTRQYARIVRDCVSSIGLEATTYGIHSMRLTKVTQIHKKNGQPACRSTAFGTHENGQHCKILGC